MPTQSRKKFIQQIGLTGMALLAQQVKAFSKDQPYDLLKSSNDNVTYYEKSAVEYESLRKGFNKRIDKYPQVIALCKNSDGVADALKYATINNLQIAIKSGGHSMEGFGCINGGMVINLSLLDKLVFTENDTIALGPACTLKKIYETVIPKGKYLSGGSCQSVAIGGLTLGGGYGLMSRNFGLTCDGLIEATMVTTEGKTVNTNDDPELLWALKGGGNGNLGIVTQMKFKLQTAPATMQSYKFRNKNADISSAKEVCRQWFTLTQQLPNTCFSAFIFNGRTTYILLTNIDENNSAVNNFIDTFKTSSTNFTQGKRLPLGQALKAYYASAKPVMFKNASAGLYKSFDEIEPVIEEVFALIKKKPGILYQVNTLGGNIQLPEFEEGSSFAHRDYLYFSELQAYWDSSAETDSFLKQFELIQQQFAVAGIKAQYRNYPDINFRDWAPAYYGKNLDRLLEVKKKYDPANILGGEQTLTV